MPQPSFWESQTFYAPQDIIIIGSGFCGLWSAYHLIQKNPHLKITILERGPIPTGASTRNAGFSCFGSPTELLHDAATMGEEKMWQLVKMRYDGLVKIRATFADNVFDYDDCGGYECFEKDAADFEEVMDKMSWLDNGLSKITGIPNTFAIADEQINQLGLMNFDHLIKNCLEGGLQPAKLIKALCYQVQQAGVQILTGVEVTQYTNANTHIHIQTSNNIDFIGHQLLICTNAFTPTLVPSIDIIPCRGQVFITEEIENLALKGTFHFDGGYYYFRNVGKRLLIGGARNKAFSDEESTSMETTLTIQHELESFTHRHLLPSNIPLNIAYRWSGIMAMGSEKLPLCGALASNVFSCVRMSGMGVALAPIVADHISDLMLGKEVRVDTIIA
jgi:gamma-glutamylputrescine oxidase